MNHRLAPVEFGGGFSTLILGRAIRQRGTGRLTTIEHNAAWVDRLQQVLADDGLSEFVEVHHCPMNDVGQERWYDLESVDTALGAIQPVDLALVDGPLAHDAGSDAVSHPRFPALASLRPHLADNFSVYLDDIHRKGELAVLRSWEQTLGVKAIEEYRRGGIGRLHIPALTTNL